MLMDADCLIKLTKAQLKERVCAAFDVVLPTKVCREVMVNADSHPECTVVQRNLDSGALVEVPDAREHAKGEEALLAAYASGEYAAIASDDRRFVRRLRVLGNPYITPAVLLLVMVKQSRLTVEEAERALVELAPMISDAETAIVKLKLEARRNAR